MKRLLSVLLSCLLLIPMLSMSACTKPAANTGDDTNVNPGDGSTSALVPDELTGLWYGEKNAIVLEINADGSGFAGVGAASDAANYSVSADTLQVSSQNITISGAYRLAEERLWITIEGKATLFTRAPSTADPALVGEWGYFEDDTAETIVFTDDFTVTYDDQTYVYTSVAGILTVVTGDTVEVWSYTVQDGGLTLVIEQTTIVCWNAESIIGSWSGMENGVAVTYTFAAGGTGSLTAMGIPLSMSWSATATTVSMTVSGFGDSDSNTVTYWVVNDVLSMAADGEIGTYTRN